MQIFDLTFQKDETGVISSLSSTLSKSGIPIFYLSTATSDYILVPYSKIAEAIKALQNHAVFFDKAIIVTEEFDEKYISSFQKRMGQLNQNFIDYAAPETIFKPTEYRGSLDCKILPDRLVLHSFSRDDYELYMNGILKILFFYNSPLTFFSLSETDEEISALFEVDSLKNFPKDTIPISEVWRPIERFKKTQHNEVGVVAVFSSLIASMNIPILYLSTFSSAFIIMQESNVPIVEIKLEASQFNVIESGPDFHKSHSEFVGK